MKGLAAVTIWMDYPYHLISYIVSSGSLHSGKFRLHSLCCSLLNGVDGGRIFVQIECAKTLRLVSSKLNINIFCVVWHRNCIHSTRTSIFGAAIYLRVCWWKSLQTLLGCNQTTPTPYEYIYILSPPVCFVSTTNIRLTDGIGWAFCTAILYLGLSGAIIQTYAYGCSLFMCELVASLAVAIAASSVAMFTVEAALAVTGTQLSSRVIKFDC